MPLHFDIRHRIGGTALTVGQLFGLSLLLALKAENQPLIPPPPVNVPRPLFDPDEA